jgi:diaminopimelate epimerase
MATAFVKYSGTGNDFILIDDRYEVFPTENSGKIIEMCDRHFGIGADGLVLIRSHRDCDFEMVFFNPDASQSLCGNGSRCAVHFAHSLGIAGEEGRFFTTDGEHLYRKGNTLQPAVSMHDVDKIDEVLGHLFVHTGSPHLLVRVEDLDALDIVTEGRQLRHRFEGGTNVNFYSVAENGTINLRTYERGVEDETLSCGTGVTAAALAVAGNGAGVKRVDVATKGGLLHVSFSSAGHKFSDIWLEGPVKRIFSGIYDA